MHTIPGLLLHLNSFSCLLVTPKSSLLDRLDAHSATVTALQIKGLVPFLPSTCTAQTQQLFSQTTWFPLPHIRTVLQPSAVNAPSQDVTILPPPQLSCLHEYPSPQTRAKLQPWNWLLFWCLYIGNTNNGTCFDEESHFY